MWTLSDSWHPHVRIIKGRKAGAFWSFHAATAHELFLKRSRWMQQHGLCRDSIMICHIQGVVPHLSKHWSGSFLVLICHMSNKYFKKVKRLGILKFSIHLYLSFKINSVQPSLCKVITVKNKLSIHYIVSSQDIVVELQPSQIHKKWLHI